MVWSWVIFLVLSVLFEFLIMSSIYYFFSILVLFPPSFPLSLFSDCFRDMLSNTLPFLLKNEIKPIRKSKKAFRKLFELSLDGHVCGWRSRNSATHVKRVACERHRRVGRSFFQLLQHFLQSFYLETLFVCIELSVCMSFTERVWQTLTFIHLCISYP